MLTFYFLLICIGEYTICSSTSSLKLIHTQQCILDNDLEICFMDEHTYFLLPFPNVQSNGFEVWSLPISASTGNLLKMQILGHQTRPTESKTGKQAQQALEVIWIYTEVCKTLIQKSHCLQNISQPALRSSVQLVH